MSVSKMSFLLVGVVLSLSACDDNKGSVASSPAVPLTGEESSGNSLSNGTSTGTTSTTATSAPAPELKTAPAAKGLLGQNLTIGYRKVKFVDPDTIGVEIKSHLLKTGTFGMGKAQYKYEVIVSESGRVLHRFDPYPGFIDSVFGPDGAIHRDLEQRLNEKLNKAHDKNNLIALSSPNYEGVSDLNYFESAFVNVDIKKNGTVEDLKAFLNKRERKGELVGCKFDLSIAGIDVGNSIPKRVRLCATLPENGAYICLATDTTERYSDKSIKVLDPDNNPKQTKDETPLNAATLALNPAYALVPEMEDTRPLSLTELPTKLWVSLEKGSKYIGYDTWVKGTVNFPQNCTSKVVSSEESIHGEHKTTWTCTLSDTASGTTSTIEVHKNCRRELADI